MPLVKITTYAVICDNCGERAKIKNTFTEGCAVSRYWRCRACGTTGKSVQLIRVQEPLSGSAQPVVELRQEVEIQNERERTKGTGTAD